MKKIEDQEIEEERIITLEEAMQRGDWRDVWRSARLLTRKNIGPKKRQYGVLLSHNPGAEDLKQRLCAGVTKGGIGATVIESWDEMLNKRLRRQQYKGTATVPTGRRGN